MLLGYNQERPKEENYWDFENKLKSGLEDLAIEGLSLMVYGSWIRKDHTPGRSDIDAVMTFPDDVVINKKNLHAVSRVLYHALKGNNIPFQVSVNDLTTIRDGRFNTYDKSFDGYFFEEGRILVGTDYRHEFAYQLPTMSEQIPVRFNLRKSRVGLLFAVHDRHEDYEIFLRRFTKTLDSVSRASKQILFFIDGTLRKTRFAAANLVREVFPEIDTNPLLRIRQLYSDLKAMDALYKRPEEIMDLWNASVTFFEEMIRGYLRKVPKSEMSKKC